MSGFSRLDDSALAHLQRLELFARLERQHRLALHADRATVRLAAAAKRADPTPGRAQLRWLAQVTAVEADAFARLAVRPGALRYCRLHIDHALEKLGIRARPAR